MSGEGEKRAAEEVESNEAGAKAQELTIEQVDAFLAARGETRTKAEPATEQKEEEEAPAAAPAEEGEEKEAEKPKEPSKFKRTHDGRLKRQGTEYPEAVAHGQDEGHAFAELPTQPRKKRKTSPAPETAPVEPAAEESEADKLAKVEAEAAELKAQLDAREAEKAAAEVEAKEDEDVEMAEAPAEATEEKDAEAAPAEEPAAETVDKSFKRGDDGRLQRQNTEYPPVKLGDAPAEEPAAEEPAAETPAAEEPAAETPVAEEPAAEETVDKSFKRGDDGRLQRQNTEYPPVNEKGLADVAKVGKETEEPATEEPAEEPVAMETEDAAETAEPEAAAEPEATEEKAEEEANDVEVADDETEDEEEAFEPLARGTKVAVAYGSIFSGSRRRWFAAEVLGYSDKSKKYTVIWKSIPKRGKAYFKCGSERVREVTDEIYEQAPEDGVSFLGFHRQSTFQAGEENPTINVGDQVAVAYGAAAGEETAVPGKFLWYAAKVTEINDDKYTVAWKFPTTKDNATFVANADKVQPITASEYNKAKKNKGKKVVYGFVGYHRLESSANLTFGN